MFELSEFSYQDCINLDEETYHEEVEINIVDAICGSGKTSAAINMINSSDEEQRFLYITPYLDEVNRIIESCPNKHFRQPEAYGTKTNGIKFLLEKGFNIVSTHALFKNFDTEIIKLVRAMNYILVMDEVAEVVETLRAKIFGQSLKIIKSNYKERAMPNHFFHVTPEQQMPILIERRLHICAIFSLTQYLKTFLKAKVQELKKINGRCPNFFNSCLEAEFVRVNR